MSNSVSILYIDDNLDHLAIVQAMLQRKNYTCEIISTAAEGIQRASAETFDIILLDIQMPKMSGIDILNHLKPRKAEIGFRVVAITADSSVFASQNPYEIGFDAVISKPVLSPDLYRTIEQLLQAPAT